jgi:hypothetical protein
MSQLIAIESILLTTITGGADARSRLLTDALDNRFGDEGVVKMIGKPVFSNTGHGLQSARGKVDVNGLWGGDTKRTFTATVDVPHHRVTGLRTNVIGAE